MSNHELPSGQQNNDPLEWPRHTMEEAPADPIDPAIAAQFPAALEEAAQERTVHVSDTTIQHVGHIAAQDSIQRSRRRYRDVASLEELRQIPTRVPPDQLLEVLQQQAAEHPYRPVNFTALARQFDTSIETIQKTYHYVSRTLSALERHDIQIPLRPGDPERQHRLDSAVLTALSQHTPLQDIARQFGLTQKMIVRSRDRLIAAGRFLPDELQEKIVALRREQRLGHIAIGQVLGTTPGKIESALGRHRKNTGEDLRLRHVRSATERQAYQQRVEAYLDAGRDRLFMARAFLEEAEIEPTEDKVHKEQEYIDYALRALYKQRPELRLRGPKNQ